MADSFVVNVEGAVYRGDEWLMIVRSEEEAHAAGTLSMVGGTVEHTDANDETLENALRRELMEEVGIEVGAKMTYVESKYFVSDIGKYVLDIVLLCEYKSGTPTAIDPAEVADIKWMKTNAIVDYDQTPPWIVQSINKAHTLRTDILKNQG